MGSSKKSKYKSKSIPAKSKKTAQRNKRLKTKPASRKKVKSTKGKGAIVPNKLPKYITINKVKHFTPSALRQLKHKGTFLSNAVKIAVYSIYLQNKKRKSLKFIVDRLYEVRDLYVKSIGAYRPKEKTIDEIIFRQLQFDDDYAYRNEVLDKLQSIHNSFPVIKNFRWQCFECTKTELFSFAEAMAQSDIEISYFWEARDMYLQTVDDDSMQFEIWYVHEELTNFMFVDFNEIGVVQANLDEFKQILRFVKRKADAKKN